MPHTGKIVYYTPQQFRRKPIAAARTLMIQGTSSDVGKSILVAALCRIYARQGFEVAPFKSQNMALNSFVTQDGFELSRSQTVQAQAAGIEPDVRMNPILLKPEADARSQIVLMGKPWKTLAAGTYYEHKQELWRYVVEALEAIRKDYELIIIEGAGSPAEINLKAHEIVNMRVAIQADAPVILAGDINQGGVFAFLYGTLMLLAPEERELIKGFIINKFRGDIKLLEPGLGMLADLTEGRPVLGVVPYLKDLRIAQEDSVFLDTHRVLGQAGPSQETVDIAVIWFPHMSNYDDYDALAMEEGATVRFVREPAELGQPDAVILPGTKTTIEDLRWLHCSGLARMIVGLSMLGKPVAGICGGYQMLGRGVRDENGVEGPGRAGSGLGLLPIETDFEPAKTTRRADATVRARAGFLGRLQDRRVTGYEIHMGKTTLSDGGQPLLQLDDTRTDGLVTPDGKIWGTYLHGIFDTPAFRRAWLQSLGWQGRGAGKSLTELREAEFDRLADAVESCLDMGLLSRIIGL